jgi:hypothetical protein
MRNRLTVQTHIDEGVIDSKKLVTTPRLLRGGIKGAKGGGVFCKLLLSILKSVSVLCPKTYTLEIGVAVLPISGFIFVNRTEGRARRADKKDKWGSLSACCMNRFSVSKMTLQLCGSVAQAEPLWGERSR